MTAEDSPTILAAIEQSNVWESRRLAAATRTAPRRDLYVRYLGILSPPRPPPAGRSNYWLRASTYRSIVSDSQMPTRP